MNLLEETKKALRLYGIRPKRSLGQSFLVDSPLIAKIVQYADLKRGDTVLDVGAGLGFLTEALANKAGRVLAVEIDPRLVRALEDRLSVYENVEVIEGDFMRLERMKFNKVVSNPPYSISSPFIFRLLEYEFDQGIITLQEDFADRLMAKSGTKEYGRLTVMANLKLKVDLLEGVPRGYFYPVPKVRSAVMCIKPIHGPSQVMDEKLLSVLVAALFSQRRRILRKAIKAFIKRTGVNAAKKEVLEDYADMRVFQLSPEDFVDISNRLYSSLRKR